MEPVAFPWAQVLRLLSASCMDTSALTLALTPKSRVGMRSKFSLLAFSQYGLLHRAHRNGFVFLSRAIQLHPHRLHWCTPEVYTRSAGCQGLSVRGGAIHVH